MRVLFVDDEVDVLRGLQCSLRRQREEWNMHFVVSGAEALQLMSKEPFDVVVSDMRMPGMDGVQLLTQVRERHPTTVRIILSGHAGEDAILRAVGPAHQYLAKPCDPGEIRSTIQAALALRSVLTDDKVKQVVARLDSIPSLPSLYQEILSELRAEEPSIRKVAEIVAKDVGMTAKLLQLVNSAFFGLSSEVTDPAKAVMHLGTDTVRALVLTNGVFTQMTKERIACDLPQLWAHSMRVAALAKAIAQCQRSSKEVLGACYQAGFLHDVGHLVLAVNMPTEYCLAKAEADKGPGTPTQSERARIGATHAEVGGYLLGIWGLPDLVVQAVTFHDEPSRFPTRGFSPLAAVHTANAIDRVLATRGALGDEPIEGLDHDYLKAAGIDGELDKWTAACRELFAEGASQ